jgi:hypothetical protein
MLTTFICSLICLSLASTVPVDSQFEITEEEWDAFLQFMVTVTMTDRRS